MSNQVSACPACGTANPGGTKFCTSCGGRLAVPPPQPPQSPPQPQAPPQPQGPPGGPGRRSNLIWAIPLGVFLIVGLATAGYLLGTPDNDSGGTAPGDSPGQAPEQQVERVEGSLFSATVPDGWVNERLDGRDSNRLVSEWSDPDSPGTSVLIDTQTLTIPVSSLESARQVRAQTRQSPGYSEIGFEEIQLAGRPTVEWTFDLPGDRRVDFLFTQCGVGIAVLGVAPPGRFEEVLPTFREVASSVAINCEPITAKSPISTQGIGPVLVGMTESEAEAAGRVEFDTEGGPGGECVYMSTDAVKDVGFMFNEGTLARIDASNATSETLSGVGVGDTEAEVFDVYGDQIEEEPNFYDPKNSSYLTFVPNDESDNTRVLFDVRNGVVVNIRAGRLPEIDFVEGCA